MLPLDKEVFWFLHGWTGRFAALDGLFIFLSKYFFWFVLAWVLWLLIRKQDWTNGQPLWKNRFQYFSLGFISFVLSRGVITNIIATLLQSPRPFVALDVQSLIYHADVSSFPSGHMASIVPIVLTLLVINRKAGWWGLLAAVLIGISRVVVGVHWPSDILGGFLIGAVSFLLVYLFFRKRKIIS
ncbi:MAG: phosphatase PAP2 family protein [bacterium]|nr:phosphatase PAP2 family protein [bacterium]